MKLEKRFSFGKVDFNGTGRRINEVEVLVSLRDNKDYKPVFSVCGEVWNSKHTDCECCGQCLDEINYFLKGNQLFAEIFDLWKKHHLNDTHRGTREQMAFLEEHKSEFIGRRCFDEELRLLKKYGMEKAADGSEFGSNYYYWNIPAEDMERIKRLLTK